MSRHHAIGSFLILIAAAVGLYFGWRCFWFLTDDAFIAFRYVSNSVLGFGYTWNLPPFRPVEGYTSFLWVLLLDVVWRITGAAPPQSANVISLGFAYGTLLLSVLMLWRMALRPSLARIRPLLLVLLLLGLLSNRTFLMWSSSGLETAMFNFFVTAWLYSLLFLPRYTSRWLGWLSTTAVLTALTRPDGLLMVAAMLLLGGLSVARRIRHGRFSGSCLAPFSPFLIIATHFLWRRVTYGAWLPNTHAAKSVAYWPESGLRYLLSFIVEYALWFWLVLALLFLVRQVRSLISDGAVHPLRTWHSSRLVDTHWPVTLAAVGVVLAHLGYYTFLIGGDLFEYRVYSHLVPFILLTAVWLLNQLRATACQSLILMLLFILCSLPVPWIHWAVTRDLSSREETFVMYVPVTPHFPAAVQPYTRLFDELQAWLIPHYVGMRHQEHKAFYQYQLSIYPPREMGLLIAPEGNPVIVVGPVGVPAWVLPTVNIIDTYGLNDRVVAQNPVDPARFRRMAHERYPPLGYVECFQPNVKLVADNKVVIGERTLTPDTIIDCETRPWPVSQGENEPRSNLEIDLEQASLVEELLWQVWPAQPLYLYYVPPARPTEPAERSQVDLAAYSGTGCVIVSSDEAYLLTFLPAEQRPPLAEVKESFPWTRLVTEEWLPEPAPYHLGYAAPLPSGPMRQPLQPATAVWDNGLMLIGVDPPPTTVRGGETIFYSLYYQVDGAVDGRSSVFNHLLGQTYNPATGGPLWGQDDGDPCRGLYPLAQWPADAIVMARFAVSIPVATPPGDYELVTGFYDWQTGERSALVAAPVGQNQVTIGTVTVQP
jgi:arabinofuranosyltransferase